MGYCDKIWRSKNPNAIKTELTIEDNPLFVVNCFKGSSREYKRRIRTADGQTTIQTIRIGQRQGSPNAFGVLKQKHQEALYILIDLWQKKGCKLVYVDSRPRAFFTATMYQIAKALCNNTSAQSYIYARSILEGLETIPIHIENAYTRRGISQIEFTILSTEFRKACQQKRATANVTILFSSVITESFIHGHAKSFSLGTYMQLGNSKRHKCAVFKLLHSMLDRELATKDKYNTAIRPLLERLGMCSYKYKSQRKQKIMPAVERLQGSLILTDTYRVSLKLELSKDQSDYVLTAYKQPKDQQEQEASRV